MAVGNDSLFFEEKSQISAELIIILAAVLAVAIILITQLQKTAKSGSEAVARKNDEAVAAIDNIK